MDMIDPLTPEATWLLLAFILAAVATVMLAILAIAHRVMDWLERREQPDRHAQPVHVAVIQKMRLAEEAAVADGRTRSSRPVSR